MGRNAGWIALHAGVASGSDAVLLPEIPFDFAAVAEHVLSRHKVGKRASLICVSEGARPVGGQQTVAHHDATSADPIRLGGVGKFVADELERRTGIESRYVILGHTQRGGSPVPADRVLGTLFGSRAIGLLRECRAGRMVAVREGKLTDVEITTPAGKQRTVPVDDPLIASARAVGTVFGG
jgi:6-phosphofructokinase 1